MSTERNSQRQRAKAAAEEAKKAAAIAAEKIGDPAFEEKLKELTPEQIELFVAALQQAMRKRRLMLLGYLSALMSIVLGMIFALVAYARHERGTFIGWVFFVPFGLAGASMWIFGRLARRIRVRVGDLEVNADTSELGPGVPPPETGPG